jgi:hypothetical protein
MTSPPDTTHADALFFVDAMAVVDEVGTAVADTIRQAIRTARPLPADVPRCPGEGFWEDGEWDWREGCEDCLRRTSPGGRVTIQPPAIIAFECEYRIGPGEITPT